MGLNLTGSVLSRVDATIAGLHPHAPELRKLLDRIPRDLEGWKDGITLEMVERTYCTVRPGALSRHTLLLHTRIVWQAPEGAAL